MQDETFQIWYLSAASFHEAIMQHSSAIALTELSLGRTFFRDYPAPAIGFLRSLGILGSAMVIDKTGVHLCLCRNQDTYTS